MALFVRWQLGCHEAMKGSPGSLGFCLAEDSLSIVLDGETSLVYEEWLHKLPRNSPLYPVVHTDYYCQRTQDGLWAGTAV